MNILNRLTSKMNASIRYKLLFLGLFPILLIMPIALGLAIFWGTNFTYEQLYIKVNTDLTVSHDTFSRIRTDYLNHLRQLGDSYKFRDILDSGDEQEINAVINELKQTKGFSYLHLVDKSGRISTNENISRVSSSLLKASNGIASVGVEIFSGEDLKNISNEIYEQVELDLIATPRAHPSEQKKENRGMIIRALYPIIDSNDHVIAILDGGLLLNQNFEFVDTIRDLVYGPGSLAEGSIGTVTVFLDDIRINTNVPLKVGERALGTRVSEEVKTQVLDNGNIWIDRAFVVNDWYISSYEPIIDIDGHRVGMLYAGYSETPYRAALWNAVIALILLFLSLMFLSAWMTVRGAKGIFKPIELMSNVVKKTSLGNFSSRIGRLNVNDELGQLAIGFDQMLDLLQHNSEEIQSWADQLEVKVDERTIELRQKNDELINTIHVLRKTRLQLVVAEKLAALGEFTAGIAHEINNPTQVMLGNLDILMAEMGDQLDPVKPEIDMVVKQIYRIQAIIGSLLQYAKPDEYSGYVNEVDVNDVINDSMSLISHMRKDYTFEMKLILDAEILVLINEQDLQQVLVNLIVNAVHALPKSEGVITVKSFNWENKGVCISVTDNGSGIDADKIDHVFNPFYSTKKQEGSGLGLSVSYGLIRKYGGNITLMSKPNVKTELVVWLLSEPEWKDDEETIAEQLSTIEQLEENI